MMSFTVFMAHILPHMVQVPSVEGGALSKTARARAGSSDRSNISSQATRRRASLIRLSRSRAPGTPLAMSAAWAAIFVATSPSRTSFAFGRRKCSAGVT